MNSKIVLLASAFWVSAFCAHFIYTAPIKVSLKELLLMMPQWCDMTEASGIDHIKLSPQNTLWCCFSSLLFLSVCWFMTAENDVDKIDLDLEDTGKVVKAKLGDIAEAELVLLESAKSLLDTVHLEYQHCFASIAANNETHGKRVGGEAEWATGETSSEDDATQEITGARITKNRCLTEEEKIMEFLETPAKALGPFDFPVQEPHLKEL